MLLNNGITPCYSCWKKKSDPFAHIFDSQSRRKQSQNSIELTKATINF